MMEAMIDQWMDWLIKSLGLEGLSIVLVTSLLAIIQGFLGIFPFATLIVMHISILGLGWGLLVSWMVGTLAAIVVFLVCRYFFYEWFNRRWGERLKRYEKWQNYMDKYGVWTVILLRTLPIMPNNLVSFMSALSPIKLSSYIWSSIIGNLSHIWLFGIISSSLIMPDMDIRKLSFSYAAFCLILLTIFVAKHYKSFKKSKKSM